MGNEKKVGEAPSVGQCVCPDFKLSFNKPLLLAFQMLLFHLDLNLIPRLCYYFPYQADLVNPCTEGLCSVGRAELGMDTSGHATMELPPNFW